jgi:hypothetical protein
MPREDDEDLRWIRPGWFDQGRPCDGYVVVAKQEFPGEDLPTRWAGVTPQAFIDSFGAGVRWAVTASYHTLWYAGVPVVRLWTNADSLRMLVDVSASVAALIDDVLPVDDVPKGTIRRRREFRKRTSVSSQAELKVVLAAARAAHRVR